MFAALEFREFRLLWAAQFGNSMGINMDQVARGWLMYDLTGSTVDLGLVTGVKVLPGLVLGPVAGVLADRGNRKLQLIAAQTINAFMNFVLAALILAGRVETWHVYATGFVVAIVQVFEIPARQSMVPETVDASHLTNAIGLNSVGVNISRSFGPAAAGVLIALLGAGGSYVVQGLIYAFSTVWTIQLSVSGRVVSEENRRGSILHGTLEGWRYIGHHPTIRGVMAMVMAVCLFGLSFTVLLPAFARDVLSVGPTGQGLLVTAMGLGALVSALVVAAHGDRLPKGKVMLAGGMLYGLCEIGFGFSSWFVVSLLLMLGIGVCLVACTVLINTVLQVHSAPDMRGRVMSMLQQSQVAMTLGGVLAGALAAVVGSPHAVVLMGVACMLSVGAIGVAMPNVRAIRQ